MTKGIGIVGERGQAKDLEEGIASHFIKGILVLTFADPGDYVEISAMSLR